MHADVPTDRPVVFYDGGCPLCRREIAHYRRLDRQGCVEWVDITQQPERLAAHGIVFADAMRRLHLRKGDGRIVTGASAFAALWGYLPYYRLLAVLVSLPGIVRLLDWGYVRFADWRWERRCAGQCALEESHSNSVASARVPPGAER